MAPALDVVFVSSVFPTSGDRSWGAFNLRQLEALRERGHELEIVAPVAWFPFVRSRSGPRTPPPAQEEIEGLTVRHPRVLYLPLSRGSTNGRLYGLSLRRLLGRMARARTPSFLWSSFAFPDGVGVAGLADELGLPHVVSVLGSDLNANLTRPSRRRAIARALGRARLVLAKSQALRDGLLGIGIPAARIRVDYNGVDPATFRPQSRAANCVRLGIPSEVRRVLFVGSLVAVKNVSCLVEAFDSVRRQADGPIELVLVGRGHLRDRLQRQVAARGLGGCVRFVGACPPDDVALWMAASDMLCLPSLSEGVPNVVLEALASGRPVVASRVGGIPEVHPGASAGALVPAGDATALTRALTATLDRRWNPESLAALTKKYTWEQNALALEGWFAEAGLRRPASTHGSEPARREVKVE